jgi:signal transduction histidine kinase
MWVLLKILYRFLARLMRHLGLGALLVPVAMLSMLLFGINVWTVAVVACAVVVAFRQPVVAATLLPVAMVVLGICGLVVVATAPASTMTWQVAAPALSILVQPAFGQASARAAAGKTVRRIFLPKPGRPVAVPKPPHQVSVSLRAPDGAALHGQAFGPGNAVLNGQAFGPGWRVNISGPLGKFGPGGPPGPGRMTDFVPGGGHVAWTSAWAGPGWAGRLILPVALLLLTLGLWLAPRTLAGARGRLTGLLPWLRRRMLENRWGILLVPVTLIGLSVYGVHLWTVAAVLAAPVAVLCWPALAADLVPVLLAVFAVRGFEIAARWQSVPIAMRLSPQLYGAIPVSSRELALLAGGEACLFLAVSAWLAPRTIGAHARGMLAARPDPELAGRLQRLTESRGHAVDAATTELRRIERDLHDGAQARLVALGMNLRAVERMLPARPEAALALVAEARETSLRALNDLRSLIRGIYPPVLADRGLGHAVRALALDTPLPTDLDIDLPGRPTAPVESACYFAVAEALANAVKHAGARRVHIRIQHSQGILRIQVADDGAGGADPALGSGLRGVERRLGTFDGILAVSSPAGGPTMIAMEVPCALSSPKTCSC